MTNGHGIGVPGTWPKPNSVNAVGKVADAPRAEDDEGQATEERERAERHDERRQPAACHEQAVEQPAQRADDEDERDGDLERHAGRPEEAEDGAGQARPSTRRRGRSRRR